MSEGALHESQCFFFFPFFSLSLSYVLFVFKRDREAEGKKKTFYKQKNYIIQDWCAVELGVHLFPPLLFKLSSVLILINTGPLIIIIMLAKSSRHGRGATRDARRVRFKTKKKKKRGISNPPTNKSHHLQYPGGFLREEVCSSFFEHELTRQSVLLFFFFATSAPRLRLCLVFVINYCDPRMATVPVIVVMSRFMSLV